jgi:hypothetical protein
MPNTATKTDVAKDLDDISARISTLVRATCVGILAVGWGFLVTPNDRISVLPLGVLVAIALAFVALLLDWAQYLVGYLNGCNTWNAMELDGELRGWTPDKFYGFRTYLFAAKQAVAFCGVAVLVGAMVPTIIRLASHQ